jgi:hypothetical protein
VDSFPTFEGSSVYPKNLRILVLLPLPVFPIRKITSFYLIISFVNCVLLINRSNSRTFIENILSFRLIAASYISSKFNDLRDCNKLLTSFEIDPYYSMSLVFSSEIFLLRLGSSLSIIIFPI